MATATIADLADVTRTHSSAIPIDVYRIIRAHGIDIHYIRASPKFSGMYIRIEGVPVILLNSRDSPARRRFTAAHELYHHLSYTEGSTDLRPLFSVQQRDLPTAELVEERKANRYATALLMPKEAIIAAAAEGMTWAAMAQRFGVSLDAMRIRLLELRLDCVLDRE